MACIAAVVLVDGFQHLEEEFFTKALAFGSVWHQTFNLCQFDLTGLLLQFPQAIATYWHQSSLHGWELNATGLPQFAVITALLAFIQDMLLDKFEQGRPVPVALTLWQKDTSNMPFFLPSWLPWIPCPCRSLLGTWKSFLVHQHDSWFPANGF